MTLKKDAVVCVSLAGVVLLMAAFSRTTPKDPPMTVALSTSETDSGVYHRPLYQLYLEAVNGINQLPAADRDAWLESARKQVQGWHRSNELTAPIDQFRAAAILGTSTESKELDLAYELSLGAWAKGVRMARRLALETQDRLLLSAGQEQRYGTQSKWHGKPLPDFGSPNQEITPVLQTDLGLNEPGPR